MEVKNIPIGEICTSPMNPRKTFDEEAIKELAENIRQQGLLQPITVRPIERSGVAGIYALTNHNIKYEIVCGERRYRAVKTLSGEDKRFGCIAAIVREMTDAEAFDAMITENLQRKDVDPVEEAFAFGQLIERGNTVEEVAARFGKSVRFVQDRVKLNNLIPELLKRVKDGEMAIVAAMMIAKLDAETQKKFSESNNHYDSITKSMAQRFIDNIFMSIKRASWYQSGNEADKDFEGGCNRKCAECPYNTANANCLFWEMKTNADDGRCTSRKNFDEKHLAYTLAYLESNGDDIVKTGEPLAYGKTAIVDTANCWNENIKKSHDRVFGAISEKGYEIVKPGEVFGGKIYYSDGDERIDQMLKNGKIYRCIDVLPYDTLPNPKIVYYYIKSETKDGDGAKGEVAPTEVVSLVGKFKRNIEIYNESIAKKHSELASSMGPSKRHGALCKEEQIAFDMLILNSINPDFFRTQYKLPRPSIGQLREIATNNAEDRDMWYREYVRGHMTTNAYPGSINATVCSDVLPIWRKNEYEEIGQNALQSLRKKNDKIKARLEELGYDVHGNKLQS